jgi:hypothetical protein
MKLHEIIEANKDPQKSILWEAIQPYINSLNTYYENQFRGEVILMVTDVMNAAQYVKLVDCEEFTEAIAEYIGCEVGEMQEQENEHFAQYETINFQSGFLSDYIKRK